MSFHEFCDALGETFSHSAFLEGGPVFHALGRDEVHGVAVAAKRPGPRRNVVRDDPVRILLGASRVRL